MRLGYYAHHHGSGHCRQIDKLAALLPVDAKNQLIHFCAPIRLKSLPVWLQKTCHTQLRVRCLPLCES